MGIAGFLKKEELENVDFGFAFMPEWQGHGYAYEASRAILAYGIKEFGFLTLDAVTMRENLSSQKLLLKLDFNPTDISLENESDMLFQRCASGN